MVRTFRHEVEEAQIRREINDITNELTYLREQLLQEGKHAGTELKVRIELLDKSLAEASKRIQGKAKALREETEAVIVSLQAQAEGLSNRLESGLNNALPISRKTTISALPNSNRLGNKPRPR